MNNEHEAGKDKKHIKVTIIWGGTGASKELNVDLTDTAGSVFEAIYDKFHQTAGDQDTFEVDGNEFARSQFGMTIAELVKAYGDELTFEVFPPTSGA